jgi:hypothetical protein
MEIKIQLEQSLIPEDVIGTLVSDEYTHTIVGEVIHYDTISGIATCELYEKPINDDSIYDFP